ncbi:N-acetylornithine aminotransferase [Candidatus Hydrogenisulfobacillus filiaventi]|uniref:N-acetylornithine aminotransferase n=1 Tax=Candidatus Hydrogenisulfobacillus filiaventi TaxID=2707344 RepID=A0A6F8ZJ29_9FIRM|nr:N-acetylornithine aminotransferase [Candidatus Hydrogenisulfobacillus filiaventi]
MSGEQTDPWVPIYRRFPVTLVRGEGLRVYDDHGRAYWDFLAGIGASALGHNHPGLRARLEGALSLLHTSNYFHNPAAEALAARLQALSGGMQVYFGNSGAEANEAAIKLVRKWGRARGRTVILAARGGFHGRTMGALAATRQPALQDPFRPMLEGFDEFPFGDATTLAAKLEETPAAAVLIEPIQGENGVVVPPAGFLREVERLCRDHGCLFLVDEVQTGMGRTGFWFAHQAEEVHPDVILLAKGLGGGVPVGAMLARPEVAATLVPGDHGSTFGGNPLAAAAGLAVLDWLEEGGLRHVQAVAPALEAALRRLQARFPALVREVRGRGLMWGLVLDRPSAPVAAAALERGLIINATAGNVVRLLPPLVVDEEAILAAEALLGEALAAVAG